MPAGAGVEILPERVTTVEHDHDRVDALVTDRGSRIEARWFVDASGHIGRLFGRALLLERQLLGVAAIAVGNARGALDAARQYTAERYQGGAQIESHPAVRILLGEAASRIEAAAAIVRSAGAETNTGRSGVLRAAAAKLRIASSLGSAPGLS